MDVPRSSIMPFKLQFIDRERFGHLYHPHSTTRICGNSRVTTEHIKLHMEARAHWASALVINSSACRLRGRTDHGKGFAWLMAPLVTSTSGTIS
jgi:hypothetical protein